MIRMPISPDNIYDEIKSVKGIVDAWEKRLGHEKLPGIDVATTDAEEKLEAILHQLTGELLLVAGKCHNLASVLAER